MIRSFFLAFFVFHGIFVLILIRKKTATCKTGAGSYFHYFTKMSTEPLKAYKHNSVKTVFLFIQFTARN